ncbi:GH3 auxin-responsive promoter family protein [Neolewinella aurantiaca]|uniref:GH3 auxin-responsive promoter family protein n=1 Tax=Neolewinella aurantiaca TaxID=2602767 RepID=A0A5C7FJA8_9BACT|nr:GH3 auxin-responsive promoter family protein [Neolewinella aurantiaca]TXF90726.1 GH3 auxin-responsive promoter family protein [Neolewinella aurantiaca]
MLKVVNTLFRTYIGRYGRELRMHYDDPLELQREVLQTILKANRSTAFGREHNFYDLIKSPDHFSEIVPVRTYEEHLPYLQRALAGERRVLTHEDADYISTTSGTTGATKYLPLSHNAISDIHLKGSWMSLACLYAKDPEIQVFGNKNLLIGGSLKGDHPTAGLPQGDISAVIINSIPRIMRSFYIPDIELATAVNYEEKIEKIARLAAKEPGITVLGGVPTWNLPLYRRILELHGGDNMLDVWPEARVFKHGGVNFAPYRAQFEELFPADDFIFQEIYNATEGFFGVQDKDHLRTMLLLLNAGVYYEFIRWEDYQQGEYGGAIPLKDVSTNETYVMLITTVAGLYRYPMGDLIEFTETDPYRIRILGRTQEFINAFGEDLLRSEAEGALLKACERSNALVREFMVAPVYINLAGSGRHHWVIEFERPPEDLASFERALDEELICANYNYAAKRSNDFAISRQEITVAPCGFFRNWMKDQNRMGGQHKVPRLANHRRYLEAVLDRLETTRP